MTDIAGQAGIKRVNYLKMMEIKRARLAEEKISGNNESHITEPGSHITNAVHTTEASSHITNEAHTGELSYRMYGNRPRNRDLQKLIAQLPNDIVRRVGDTLIELNKNTRINFGKGMYFIRYSWFIEMVES